MLRSELVIHRFVPVKQDMLRRKNISLNISQYY